MLPGYSSSSFASKQFYTRFKSFDKGNYEKFQFDIMLNSGVALKFTDTKSSVISTTR